MTEETAEERGVVDHPSWNGVMASVSPGGKAPDENSLIFTYTWNNDDVNLVIPPLYNYNFAN